MRRAGTVVAREPMDTAMLIMTTKMAELFLQLKIKLVMMLMTVVVVIRITSCCR
jgi:hypothetical protein